MQEHVAVVGLGYVGLPVAVAFARRFPGTVGFDVDRARVRSLREGGEALPHAHPSELRASGLRVSDDPADLAEATFYVVTVPTPIDANRQPDLTNLREASDTVGRMLRPGDVVVYESTVYPGATEEVCIPRLEEASGLRAGSDFRVGYSPERLNPGDPAHGFEQITKVVAGQDEEALARIAACYAEVVEAELHRAPGIRVAEAAKVIENTQRDVNIALMNELSVILDRLDVPTRDVLAAARTKWNFLPFRPGLVGGHCIGVDPYYLAARAQAADYHPEVILAGRRINDGMGTHVAQRLVKLLIHTGRRLYGARIGVLGLTFKENVADVRNSGVVRIVEELRDFGAEVHVHDPVADPAMTRAEHGLELEPRQALRDLDGLVVAVPHDHFAEAAPEELLQGLSPTGVVADVCHLLDRRAVPAEITYWSL